MILELLSQHNAEWLKMCNVLTSNRPDDAADLLQDFYLLMHKKEEEGKIKLKGDFNVYKNYVFTILKNLSSDKRNSNRQQNVEHELKYDSVDEYDDELYVKETFEDFYTIIEDYLKNKYKENDKIKQYMVGLLKLNCYEGMSYNLISTNTGITKRKIQTAIGKVKFDIKSNYLEHYNDYKKRIKDGKE